LKNMMESEDFGTQLKKRFILDKAGNSINSLRTLSIACQPTSSWMENYGESLISFIYWKTDHNILFFFRFGREHFQEALTLAHAIDANRKDLDWGSFKFMVFDIPTHKGTFKERYAALGNSHSQIHIRQYQLTLLHYPHYNCFRGIFFEAAQLNY